MATQNWEVFHIMIAEGSYFRGSPHKVETKWRDLLGERAITLADHTKLAELIVSIIEVNQGESLDRVSARWARGTELVVRESLKQLALPHKSAIKGGGVIRF